MTRPHARNVRRIGGAISYAAMAMILATSAHAQEAAQEAETLPADEEEIVVTGIRRGIQDSIDIKRRETSIVEAVSAEDIGKLPDISIAESIARLPGLAAQRVGGRAQVISIRGLAPDFTTTLLNGRQQASSGDNRAVEFDQYPSELLSSVVIYKTPDANVAGMGLSGTADLRTVRPLTFGRQAVAVNLRGEMNDGGYQLNDDVNRLGGRFSVSYIDQFADNRLGIALGYAYLDSPSQTRHHKTWGFEAFSGLPDQISPDSAENAFFANGAEAFATSREQKRHAVMGIVEWQPSDAIHSTLDVYYSSFKQEETMRGAQWFSNPWADGLTFTDVEVTEIGGSQFGSSGVANRVVPIIRNDFNTRDDDLFSAGLNNEFQLSDRLSAAVDLSYSRNRRKEQILETYAGYGMGTGGVTGATPEVGRTFDSIAFDYEPNGFPTYSEGLDYADASQVSLGDRAPWGGWAHDGSIRFPDVEEKVFAVDGGLAYDSEGFFDRFDVGLNYTRRDKTKTVSDNDLFLKNGRQQVLVDPQYLVDPTSLAFAGFGEVLSIDMARALDVYWTSAPILDANYFDKNWDITEKVLTAGARASFRSGPLRGNVGVQLVHQDQQSTGVVIQGSPIVPTEITDGDSYTDILPSLNSIYELGGGHQLRFAVAKVMARPRMDEMRANLTPGFGVDPSTQPGETVHPWSATGGNPNLRPWKATAFDLAYEWYLGSATYLSIAGFYKDLDTYIYNQLRTFDFTGIPIPTGATIPPGVIIDPIGTVTQPANGEGGSIKGLEFSGAVEFGRIIPFLDGFGAQGSLSLTESNLNPVYDPGDGTSPPPVRIPGLSGTVYNITGYYEKGGFQARASYRYRSAFKGEVVQLFATRGYTEILADKQIDAQIGYTFPEDSRFGNLGVLLQVINVTDAPYRTRLGLDTGGVRTGEGDALLETYEKYGRQILLGVNYRF